MQIRRHLSYANVAATVALVVGVGTGGAYAASQIGSGDIRDNSVRSKDLRDRKAVKGVDVARNSLGGQAINERKLKASQFAPMAGRSAINCNPAGAAYATCVGQGVRLRGRGRLLIIATGQYFSVGGPTALDCRIAVDGRNDPTGVLPGEAAAANTASGATDGFADTLVTRRLKRGRHEVALRCAQIVPGDGRLRTASIAVLGITG